jgi:dTDP-glucose pyrophosphorylase
MKDTWKNALIPPDASIRQAIAAIDNSRIQIALVVGPDALLIGTVTDGDIRRALLRGISVDDPIATVMNGKPTTLPQEESAQRAHDLMRRTTHRCIPRVDGRGGITGVWHLSDFLQTEVHDNVVVVMAGGLGTRLNPITEALPKPLIRIGAKPILETILDNFREFGFREFYLSVNYKAEMVKEYFGDGSRWGISIRYLEESKRLGTAGALSLLPVRPTKPLIVMNGDLLTKVNFQQLLDFHHDHDDAATMCVREYDLKVPFGVVTMEDHHITAVDEKPVQRFFVNAGIYVLEPDTLDCVPREEQFDMTSLFQMLVESGQRVSAFPIREYWLDVGRLDDLERARLEFGDPEA